MPDEFEMWVEDSELEPGTLTSVVANGCMTPMRKERCGSGIIISLMLLVQLWSDWPVCIKFNTISAYFVAIRIEKSRGEWRRHESKAERERGRGRGRERGRER